MADTKRVQLDLTKIKGASAIVDAFRRQARREGRSAEEIEATIDRVWRVDYDDLIARLESRPGHCGTTNSDVVDPAADKKAEEALETYRGKRRRR